MGGAEILVDMYSKHYGMLVRIDALGQNTTTGEHERLLAIYLYSRCLNSYVFTDGRKKGNNKNVLST